MIHHRNYLGCYIDSVIITLSCIDCNSIFEFYNNYGLFLKFCKTLSFLSVMRSIVRTVTNIKGGDTYEEHT